MKVKIIVINLSNEIQRRMQISEILSGFGVDYKIFDAFTYQSIPHDFRSFFDYGSGLLSGEIGCYASHLAIMREIANGNFPSPLMVMEDDAAPTPAAVPIMRKAFELVAAYPEEIEYLNLFQRGPRAVLEKRPLMEGVDIIRNFIPSLCCHCYIITKSGSRKFLSFRKKRTLPVDVDIFYAAVEADLKVWETSKAIICQNAKELESTIDPEGRRAFVRPRQARLSYKRRVARKKFGVIPDIKYYISRRIWKLNRYIENNLKKCNEISLKKLILMLTKKFIFNKYSDACSDFRE